MYLCMYVFLSVCTYLFMYVPYCIYVSLYAFIHKVCRVSTTDVGTFLKFNNTKLNKSEQININKINKSEQRSNEGNNENDPRGLRNKAETPNYSQEKPIEEKPGGPDRASEHPNCIASSNIIKREIE